MVFVKEDSIGGVINPNHAPVIGTNLEERLLDRDNGAPWKYLRSFEGGFVVVHRYAINLSPLVFSSIHNSRTFNWITKSADDEHTVTMVCFQLEVLKRDLPECDD